MFCVGFYYYKIYLISGLLIFIIFFRFVFVSYIFKWFNNQFNLLRVKSKGKSVFILHILPSALKIMPFTSPFTITIHSSKQPTQQFLLQVYQYTSFSCVLTEKGVEEKNKPCEKNHSPLTYILNFKNEKTTLLLCE